MNLRWQECLSSLAWVVRCVPAGRMPERRLRGGAQELGERQLAAYRYNMLSHRGEVSSFTVRMNRRAFPGCYDLLSRVRPPLPPSPVRGVGMPWSDQSCTAARLEEDRKEEGKQC